MGEENNSLLQVATVLGTDCIHTVLKEKKKKKDCKFSWLVAQCSLRYNLVSPTTKYNIKRWLGSLLMKHKCMFYWFNLEHYRVHGLRDGIRLMLDFGINHYRWKWFDVCLQHVFSTVQSGFVLSTVAQRMSAALYCYCAMLHYNHTVILFKQTQLMVTLKAFRNEYSGSQAIKLIMVNVIVSVPLIWALGITQKLLNCQIP